MRTLIIVRGAASAVRLEHETRAVEAAFGGRVLQCAADALEDTLRTVRDSVRWNCDPLSLGLGLRARHRPRLRWAVARILVARDAARSRALEEDLGARHDDL